MRQLLILPGVDVASLAAAVSVVAVVAASLAAAVVVAVAAAGAVSTSLKLVTPLLLGFPIF